MNGFFPPRGRGGKGGGNLHTNHLIMGISGSDNLLISLNPIIVK
jgi:hypothetical protein